MIYTLEQIKACVNMPKVIALMEEGFVRYSKGESVVPPFGSLHFEKPSGEAHIKYGYIKDQDVYVVKVASNFCGNKAMGKSPSQGVMLVFSRYTGELKAVLNDRGYLTDFRTAAAGAVSAKYLAPKKIHGIGIVGTGTQAFHQLLALKEIVECRKVIVWGRNDESIRRFVDIPELSQFQIETTREMAHLAHACNLIVTTTPSSKPLLFTEHVQPGTHITAVGADDKGKQELDTLIFKRADIVAVDSRSQCFSFGDSSQAIKMGHLDTEKVHELGEIVIDPRLGRTSENQITVADLTGVAIQDIQIATAVLEQLCNG